MKTISFLKNSVQEYNWGSKTFIQELLGKSSDNPMAELWMGAHPKAPSSVFLDNKSVPLPALIQKEPLNILGPAISGRFNKELPFLFKILAASMPLSIQAHPDRQQAVTGFENENSIKISINSPIRNYRDKNHKPEILCAITPFTALKGFRNIEDILFNFSQFDIPSLKKLSEMLNNSPDQNGLKKFFSSLMTLEPDDREEIINKAVLSAEKVVQPDQEQKWIIRFRQVFGMDLGVLSPLFLNLVHLNPGDALFIPSGELHAYLDGNGIELMANSDNVLRGGLTTKHVDVNELINILNFNQKPVEILRPEKSPQGELKYKTPAEEFALSIINLEQEHSYRSPQERNVEIMICVNGNAGFLELESGQRVDVTRGESIIIPAAVKQYNIQGNAMLYKATVP